MNPSAVGPDEAHDARVRPSLPSPASAEARLLSRTTGLTLTMADLLIRRGFSDPQQISRFLEPKLAHLTPPEAMIDREVAADRIAFAIRSGQPICVFGDYDCDGITSAAIMTSVIQAFGGRVQPMLASRFDGGYGVSPAAVARIVASGSRLLVTCDCGSSDHASLAEVVARGIDVIVIDHHLVPPEPLPALAFLNPHRPDCGFPYKGLASCGLALSIAAALRKRIGTELDLRLWLDLVAIGTIADVAPLDGDNRALVRAGLRLIGEARRPGIRALLELARFDGSRVPNGEDIAYRIAPRINSPGRLGKPDLALELLLARSHETARAIAAEIEQLSSKRREIQDKMIAEAIVEIESAAYAERAAIVIGREGWSHGIVGIVAGRLASKYERPVIVVGFENGVGRGSVRGPRGARLFDALKSAEGALERFGGHQAAAGVEVRSDRLDDLRAEFERAISTAPAVDATDSDEASVWLAEDDDPNVVVRDLAKLEPCGERNPAPNVALEARLVTAREVRGGHLKLELELSSGRRIAGFGFSMGERAADLPATLVVVGQLRPDAWRGGSNVEIRVSRVIS